MKLSDTVYPVGDTGVLATPVAASQNGTTGALNTAIVVNVPALGAAAPGVSVTAHGFQT